MSLKPLSFLLAALCSVQVTSGQSIADRLERAWDRFAQDSQMRAGIASLCVVDTKTGGVVFERNAHTGLATASTLKVITAATAYEVLGKDFRYVTRFAHDGIIDKGHLKGSLYIVGSGDPTLGSWRWKSTGADSVFSRVGRAAVKAGIRTYSGNTGFFAPGWNEEAIPDGWTWNDIGQYYGAASTGLTWHENQFDIKLRTGSKEGDSVTLVSAAPDPMQTITIRALTGKPGSGDETYVYHAIGVPASSEGFGPTLRGTLPPSKTLTVSASLPDPQMAFLYDLRRGLEPFVQQRSPAYSTPPTEDSSRLSIFHREVSPPLDSISYWFLRRSVNLYGEALLKTMAQKQTGTASTDKGVALVKSFWKDRGIDPAELALRDGSGLSPENRVSTSAEVQVLQYARQRPWFSSYFAGFPEYNGMKMKSGTISNVKGFCGYHTAKDGSTYTFSMLVNNYNGSTAAIVRKMYALLDELK